MRKYLLLFFALGVIFRLWISHLVPQPFAFDQTEYHFFATQMMAKGLFAWSARLYGYPFFLAIIYKIFGAGNLVALGVIQAILDSLTALIVYFIALKIFHKKIVAVISFLLYLFNPFTSVLTSLALSEVLTVFLVAVITYLLVLILERGPAAQVSQTPLQTRACIPRSNTVKLRLESLPRVTPLLGLVSLLLGFLPQVRPSFLFYSLLVFSWLLLRVLREVGDMRVIITSIVLFLLPFTYNIIGNWIYFREASPTTVDNLFVRELYISLYVPGRFDQRPNTNQIYPRQVQDLYAEYSSVPQNGDERKMMVGKYLNLSMDKIKNGPGEFISSRIEKMWFVWEKHFLYLYNQPENKVVDALTYWGNNIILVLAVGGFIAWLWSKSGQKYLRWGFIIILLALYISAAHAFSATDERYSIPAYPVVFLFAGYGIYLLSLKLCRT